MTIALDVELNLDSSDRYLLPLPGPDTPVVLPQFVVAIHAHLNARYGDAAWSLGPLTPNPSTSKPVINWSKLPDRAGRRAAPRDVDHDQWPAAADLHAGPRLTPSIAQ